MTITRRSLLQAAGAVAALAASPARAATQQLKFSYQRSSTLLTILKEHKTLEGKLGPKGFEPAWYLFNDVISPMTSGAVDFHADVADAVPIFTQAAGAKLTIYAREAPSPQAEAIIVHADSSIKTVADLKGKTVAVRRGSGAHFVLAAALKRAGLSFADINPAYLAPTDAAPAFERRSIDAWSIWDPFLSITESRNPSRRLTDATGLSGYQRFYLVNDDFVAARPEVVQIVFDALVQAGKWVKANPKEAAIFLSPLWGNVPVDVVETVNSRRSYQVLPVEKSDLGDQQKIADTFYDAKLIPKAINATDVKLWHPKG
ncbi:MAG: aliphatic sulfonate ABC transporter substrate-binding protein [Methylovirgula sp.]